MFPDVKSHHTYPFDIVVSQQWLRVLFMTLVIKVQQRGFKAWFFVFFCTFYNVTMNFSSIHLIMYFKLCLLCKARSVFHPFSAFLIWRLVHQHSKYRLSSSLTCPMGIGTALHSSIITTKHGWLLAYAASHTLVLCLNKMPPMQNGNVLSPLDEPRHDRLDKCCCWVSWQKGRGH